MSNNLSLMGLKRLQCQVSRDLLSTARQARDDRLDFYAENAGRSWCGTSLGIVFRERLMMMVIV
jgi:hypothetical protein